VEEGQRNIVYRRKDKGMRRRGGEATYPPCAVDPRST
jgi:hypothetical protein